MSTAFYYDRMNSLYKKNNILLKFRWVVRGAYQRARELPIAYTKKMFLYYYINTMKDKKNSVKEEYSGFIDSPIWISLYNDFKRILYWTEDSLVQKINNNILQDLDIIQKQNLDVCDIWWSDGKRISHILKYMNWLFKIKFNLDFCEQSKICVDMFDTSVIADFCQTTKYALRFEDMPVMQKYDLIFLIHSIFTFKDKQALDKLMQLKKTDGNIIIVSNWSQSFLAWLKKIVDSDYLDTRMEIDAVINYLDTNKIQYHKKSFKTVWCQDKISYDDKIAVLLNWISLAQYNNFSSSKKAAIKKYINDNSVLCQWSKVLFEEEEIVIVI